MQVVLKYIYLKKKKKKKSFKNSDQNKSMVQF